MTPTLTSPAGRRSRRAAVYVAAFALLVATLCFPPGGVAPYPPKVLAAADPTVWSLVWDDEFNAPDGTGIDTTKWTAETGGNGWGNNELETYTSRTQNASISNGTLVIKATKEDFTGTDGILRHYTSARLKTQAKFEQAYGRFEARVKVPFGQGLWPAFWMLGSGCPETPWPDCGEIDIMESKGSLPTMSSSALHGPGYSGQTPFANWQKFPRGTITDFHTYAVEWDTRSVQWLVDGVPHYQVGATDIHPYGRSVLGKSFIVILNMAIGGHFDGNPQSDTIFPATMLVDYVRVYAPKSR